MKVRQSSLRAQRFSELISILLLCLLFVGVGWENLYSDMSPEILRVAAQA